MLPLLLATSLAEGAGLFFLALPWHGKGGALIVLLFGVLLLARAAIWIAYRQRLAGRMAARANSALDRAGRVLLIGGTAVPMALLLAVLAAGGASGVALGSLAGLAAALGGAYVKFTLITRAGFNQGFALQEVPVRGARWLGNG
jgi:phenylacetyl-CoA:acceptor oxidoreductase subunit 2